MIHFLKGIVEEITEDALALDVGGVGYKVYAPSRFLSQVAEGEALKVHTFTYVREDIFALYGFADPAERQLFETLMGVSGVGAKMAMGLLSGLSAKEITDAVSTGDVATLTRANGVGKKLAERLILELKSKLGSLDVSNITSITSGGSVASSGQSDVLSALTNMGFRPAQAQQAIARASEELGEDADFGALLKSALKSLRSA